MEAKVKGLRATASVVKDWARRFLYGEYSSTLPGPTALPK